jgi:hypothetical protein
MTLAGVRSAGMEWRTLGRAAECRLETFSHTPALPALHKVPCAREVPDDSSGISRVRRGTLRLGGDCEVNQRAPNVSPDGAGLAGGRRHMGGCERSCANLLRAAWRGLLLSPLLGPLIPLGPLQQQVFQLLTTRVTPHQLGALSNGFQI